MPREGIPFVGAYNPKLFVLMAFVAAVTDLCGADTQDDQPLIPPLVVARLLERELPLISEGALATLSFSLERIQKLVPLEDNTHAPISLPRTDVKQAVDHLLAIRQMTRQYREMLGEVEARLEVLLGAAEARINAAFDATGDYDLLPDEEDLT